MAERGREKGRRTAAETEREALARSGTDGGTRKPETAVRLARGIAQSGEKGAKRARRRGAVTFGRSTGRRDDDDDERERDR